MNNNNSAEYLIQSCKSQKQISDLDRLIIELDKQNKPYMNINNDNENQYNFEKQIKKIDLKLDRILSKLNIN